MSTSAITPEQAVTLLRGEASAAVQELNDFAAEAFRTRGGRLGSGMGSLLEAVWVYYINRALGKLGGIGAEIEIGWLSDHELNDFACVRRDAAWESSTRNGELFRVEAKSMNLSVDESKGHFTELRQHMGEHDQLLVLIWKWVEVDEWRFCPQVVDYFLGDAQPVAELRDLLHEARGGSFVGVEGCPDGCDPSGCGHIGEPLNASGKRERRTGPSTRKPSDKVSFAANFGGLVRMLKTENDKARSAFRKARAESHMADAYITFIHRNFPYEESNQYLAMEWRLVGQAAGVAIKKRPVAEIIKELRATKPDYRILLRDRLKPD